MKKTLALVLALAMVFSTITVAFAEDALGEDAQICEDLGMLKGETGTVDAAYVATAPTRLQAAVMFLRLKGLEAEALAFTGEENFADGDIAWAEGANLIAYLKANPQLGWIGDGVSFNPTGVMTAQAYYKVLLEALGYKQTTAEVAGDFTWEEVLTFAESVGLSKVAAVESFTVNDLAVATVEALKVNVKDTEKTLAATLVEAGVVGEAAAVAAGLVEAAPTAPAVAIDEAVAVGSAAVDVTFEDDVDASAADAANFAIEGLEILDAAVVDEDTIRLTTEAMTSGKVYKLTMGEQTVQFTGVKKVSGGPEIDKVVSEDVEEVVITFKKNIDLATGSDPANYSIAGVEIVSAEVDEDEVILTTEGLKNKTKYTVKVTNVKSVDGVAKKSASKSFTVKYDLVAPKIDDAYAETNQRVIVKFTEKVTEETATDLANYSIRVDETDGAELEILDVKFIKTGDDKEKKVELVTEPQEKREDYELTVSNIADKRKVPNVITRASKKDFEGKGEDEKAPTFDSLTVLSPTTLLVVFTDDSKIDEATALDTNNYDLEDLVIESISTLKNVNGEFKALLTIEEMETGESYDLEIVDVLDEFGNALKSTKKVAKGVAGNFKAVKVTDAIATDENTILVVFDGEVDEDSAENISNYEIDEEIGAPTEAEYDEVDVDNDGTIQDDEKYVVTLTVNDLVNGYELAFDADFWAYDLTVDGVKDLADNELYYEVEVVTATANWDKTAPELEDVDVINDRVIALAFDEAVKYNADNAGLELRYDLEYVDDVLDDWEVVILPARDYADDFTVVEFSGDALTEGEAYTVVRVVYGGDFATGLGFEDGGIRDLNGNLLKAIKFGDFEFEGIADVPEGPEVDSYEQVNGTTFEVTMTRWVKVVDDGGDVIASRNVTATVDDDTYTFKVSADEDVLTFVCTEPILEEDYTFNFASFVVDYHGTAAVNSDDDNETIIAGEYEDEDAPYIEEVVAADRDTIKVTFSEEIPKVEGAAKIKAFVDSFTLKNYDLDKEISLDDTVLGDNDGDNVIKLTVKKPLESRYEYELTLEEDSIEDYVELKNEDEESFYFDGTNLQP